jgi:hypothetical protein
MAVSDRHFIDNRKIWYLGGITDLDKVFLINRHTTGASVMDEVKLGEPSTIWSMER